MAADNVPSIEKLANALFANARPGIEAYLLPLAVEGVAGAVAFGAVLAAAKKICGGLWVGGAVTLTNESLEFRPNAANQFLHQGNYRVVVPLSEVAEVRSEFGFVTGIVCLDLPHATFKVRVYGAKEFAESIRERIKGLKGHEI